jgi:diguanylate cyclase (GGDEF)-like protein
LKRPQAGLTDELVKILDDTTDVVSSSAAAPGAAAWQVLIVDDEAEVHRATAFALAGLMVQGRGLLFLHAYGEADARAILQDNEDVAVILLDVVMEAGDSGLRIVRFVREQLKRRATRIVLHTGQPGYAPELQVIQEYDINDYRVKAELTRSRLAVTMVAAIRSFEQIRAIEAGRASLETMVAGAADLFAWRGADRFRTALLAHGCRLLGPGAEGFVCAPVSGDTALEGGAAPVLRIVAANGGFASLAGTPLAELGGAQASVAVEEARSASANRYGPDSATLFVRDRAGAFLVVFVRTLSPARMPDTALLDVFCANAAVALENGRLFERLRTVAYTDALTGLPNRTGFIARVEERIGAGRAGAMVAIIDVDQFSEINDAFGHAHGDLLLKAVAARLAGSLRGDVVVARVAGDAFGVLGAEAVLDPEQILGLFARPFRAGPHRLQVSASIGLVRLGETHGSGVDAVKDASIGLERAKVHRHGSYRYFTHAMEVETRERVSLALDLRRALRARQLQLYYQPQIDLATGRVVGAEALLRWRNAAGVFVPPGRFIPVAESSGLIRPIGAWVLRTAAGQLSAWRDRWGPQFRLGVNVSAEQFRAPGFGESVRATLAAFDIDPRCLELEITESVFMDETETVQAALRALRALGVSIAIDDFGTGYSSFGYLQRMHLDRLKIDRTFVLALSEAPAPDRGAGEYASIPEMIVKLGHSLGLSVVAEGVETEPQAQHLRAAGCEEVQGFLYCKPLPADEFEQWMTARGVPAAG